MNAPGGVPLLTWRTDVLVEHLVDEGLDHAPLRPSPLRVTPNFAAMPRLCRPQTHAPEGTARTIPLWLSSPQKAPQSDRDGRRFKDGSGPKWANWSALQGQNLIALPDSAAARPAPTRLRDRGTQALGVGFSGRSDGSTDRTSSGLAGQCAGASLRTL
jgi:hypothetical protein